MTDITKAGTYRLGDRDVNRMGYGAMRLSGPGIYGPPQDRDQAIAVTSSEVYDRYMRYLIGCSDFFQRNVSEVGQFTLVKG